MTVRRHAWLAVTAFALAALAGAAEHPLVLQTDFGLKDGAVGAMRGIAAGVNIRVPVHDLSHDNTPFNLWEGAYRLKQAAPFWPEGTVFVSVIDPGVGTERTSIVLRTKSGHLFVGPNNGTFTLVAEELGIAEIRLIDETKNRRPGSDRSYTFHGRDIYAYVGARLAAEAIRFEEVGPVLGEGFIALAHAPAQRDGDAVAGSIPVLDFQYGNVWTNVGEELFAQLTPKVGDRFHVTIRHAGRRVFAGDLPYAHTFGEVAPGAPLLYLNSLMNVSFALNTGDFAKLHGIGSGADWTVRIEKAQP